MIVAIGGEGRDSLGGRGGSYGGLLVSIGVGIRPRAHVHTHATSTTDHTHACVHTHRLPDGTVSCNTYCRGYGWAPGAYIGGVVGFDKTAKYYFTDMDLVTHHPTLCFCDSRTPYVKTGGHGQARSASWAEAAGAMPRTAVQASFGYGVCLPIVVSGALGAMLKLARGWFQATRQSRTKGL